MHLVWGLPTASLEGCSRQLDLLAMALTAAQLEAGSLALDPEFSYLLSDRGVATETRGRLGHVGVTRLNVFAKIETTEADFREWARTTLALDPASTR